MMTNNLPEFCVNALARYDARHAQADSLLFNSAGFTFDRARGVYVVTVRDQVVLETPSLNDVKAFSMMHNGRMADACACNN